MWFLVSFCHGKLEAILVLADSVELCGSQSPGKIPGHTHPFLSLLKGFKCTDPDSHPCADISKGELGLVLKVALTIYCLKTCMVQPCHKSCLILFYNHIKDHSLRVFSA